MKKGWQKKRFVDCIVPLEYTRKIQRKDFLVDGKFPIISQEAKFINGYWNDEADVFKVSAPVVIFGDHTQVLKYVDFNFVLGADGVKILQPRVFLWPKFLYYQLQAANFTSLGYARHYRLLKELEIKYPPLPEQRRIVGILDKTFEGIATAKANTEKNLQNAHAIFESRLQTIFSHPGKNWMKKKLEEMCDVFADGDWVESKDQSPEGIRLIQTGNVGKGVFKDRCDKARYISEATFKRLRCTEIFEGDCLISRLPDPVGRSCLLPDTGERMITAVDCTIVRFNKKFVIPAFFVYFSLSQDYLRFVDSKITGTTRNRISRSNLGQIEIPAAPLDVQKQIIAELDSLSVEIQRLVANYEHKLAALEALKKSLLHHAFNGEL